MPSKEQNQSFHAEEKLTKIAKSSHKTVNNNKNIPWERAGRKNQYSELL